MNTPRPDREAGVRRLEIVALCLILTLPAYLRLVNVAGNPAWYTDEGTHLDVAQNLLREVHKWPWAFEAGKIEVYQELRKLDPKVPNTL